MKISTKNGDAGRTKLVFMREVSKCCLRVRAYGAVDELEATLGLARSFAKKPMDGFIFRIQENLVFLMTELATAKEDFHKLAEKSMKLLDESHIGELEHKIDELEGDGQIFCGWKHSGETHLQAALDMARAKCRSAEREIVELSETEGLSRDFPLRYLNRLSDLLWLLAQSSVKKL